MSIKFELSQDSYSGPMNTRRTPSEAAILWYLRALKAEGKIGATREEILSEVGISEATFARAMSKLKDEGAIRRITRYEAA